MDAICKFREMKVKVEIKSLVSAVDWFSITVKSSLLRQRCHVYRASVELK